MRGLLFRIAALSAPLGLALGCDAGAPKVELAPALANRIAAARAEARERPAALLELGALQLEAGRLFDAADTFLAARERGVDDVRVDAGLARTYVRLGYLEATVRSLRSCFGKDRQQPDCLFAFASLIERDPTERAQKEAQLAWARFLLVAPKDHPKRSYAESALAQLNGRFGEASAEEVMGSAPAPRPEGEAGAPPPEVPGHEAGAGGEVGELNPFGKAIQRAYAALAEERPEAAIEAFEAALEIRPDDPATLAGLAEAQLAAEQTEAARATAEKAYALAPAEAPVRYAFGKVMLQLRVTDEAEAALEAWRALLRDTPEYAKRLGVDRVLESANPPE